VRVVQDITERKAAGTAAKIADGRIEHRVKAHWHGAVAPRKPHAPHTPAVFASV
jgi:hypothetical protein